jgi:hypothetical protein
VLAEYSVGLLKRRQADEVASHLQACARCSGEWKTLHGVLGLVEKYAAVEPPPGLWNAVYNRISEDAPRTAVPLWWQWVWTRPAPVLGSAVAALALAGTLWMFGTPTGFRAVAPEEADRELIVAVREHALASADGIFADRAGLESLAVLASR